MEVLFLFNNFGHVKCQKHGKIINDYEIAFCAHLDY